MTFPSNRGRDQRPPAPRPLQYRKLQAGRDYWIVDNALPSAMSVRERTLSREDWGMGFPHRPESWPGRRVMPGLQADELEVVNAHMRALTGAKKVWIETAGDGATLNHNCIQVVGIREGEVRPHTDSRRLCRYAGVLYLNPGVPDRCGTSFFRQQTATGQLGGNTVQAPHATLVDALGTRFVSQGAFVEDVRVPHKFNRLLIYAANIVHSASAYCGEHLEDMRMAAVFFWMV